MQGRQGKRWRREGGRGVRTHVGGYDERTLKARRRGAGEGGGQREGRWRMATPTTHPPSTPHHTTQAGKAPLAAPPQQAVPAAAIALVRVVPHRRRLACRFRQAGSQDRRAGRAGWNGNLLLSTTEPDRRQKTQILPWAGCISSRISAACRGLPALCSQSIRVSCWLLLGKFHPPPMCQQSSSRVCFGTVANGGGSQLKGGAPSREEGGVRSARIHPSLSRRLPCSMFHVSPTHLLPAWPGPVCSRRLCFPG